MLSPGTEHRASHAVSLLMKAAEEEQEVGSPKGRPGLLTDSTYASLIKPKPKSSCPYYEMPEWTGTEMDLSPLQFSIHRRRASLLRLAGTYSGMGSLGTLLNLLSLSFFIFIWAYSNTCLLKLLCNVRSLSQGITSFLFR